MDKAIIQKSPKYLIVGRGRLAKHLSYYFLSLDITHDIWDRKMSTDLLKEYVQNVDIVLLAIPDDSIEAFVDSNKDFLTGKTIIHFSGSLVTEKAYGCHPLMTFAEDLYEPEFYKTILFCLDEGIPDFNELFPQLLNPHIKIPADLKPFYHSLCVLANNFTCLLWQKFYDEMNTAFGAKPEHLDSFLKKTTSNILKDHKTCLTGPLVRDDMKTIKKNLDSLQLDPFKQVYKSFVDAYNKTKKDMGE